MLKFFNHQCLSCKKIWNAVQYSTDTDQIFCYLHHVFQVFFLGLNKTISSNLDICFIFNKAGIDYRLHLSIWCFILQFVCFFLFPFQSIFSSSLLYHKYSRIVVIWHEEFYTNKLNFNRKKKKQLNVFTDLRFVRYNRTGYKQDQVNIIIKLWSWEGQQVGPYKPTMWNILTGTSCCQFSKFWELTVNLQPCFCHCGTPSRLKSTWQLLRVKNEGPFVTQRQTWGT